MEIIFKIFHIVISFILIFVVLLQSGKGAAMGATFGGSSSSRALFGATGANTFMAKLTTFTAVLFIITCLTLAYMSSHMATSSLMSDVQAEVPVAAPPGEMPVGTELPPAEGEMPADHPPMGKSGAAEESHEGHDHPPIEKSGAAEESHEGHDHP
jgi:preprotein translocase subunit SecG